MLQIDPLLMEPGCSTVKGEPELIETKPDVHAFEVSLTYCI